MEKKHIFIVEDDIQLMHSIMFTLKRHNYDVSTTNSTKNALASLLDKHRPIDLLITDIQLPDMTGKELVYELVKQHALPPTLVMTAFGTKEMYDDLFQKGVKECLDKPFDIQELVDKVSAIVGVSS